MLGVSVAALTRAHSVLLIRINSACQEASAADCRQVTLFGFLKVDSLRADQGGSGSTMNRCEKVLGALGGRVVAAAGALLLAVSACGPGIQAALVRPTGATQSDRSIADGRQVFENRCAACHGIDGRGGERAPDIATSAKTQRRSDAELVQIITSGIPSGGMPAFSTLDASTGRALVRYLRFLQGKTGSAALPGNPQSGKAIFFGRARCSECHLAAGAGGFIASDLSSYGRARPAEEIRDAIVKPGQPSNDSRGTVTIVTRDGQTLTGILRNEDNFSVQLQSLDGAFHLLMKSEVASVSRDRNSLMPADYGSTLSANELNDLVSFLMSMAQREESSSDAKKNEPSDDDE
jgi:cytochrome c oxidase cbb3-type subunit III